MKRDARQILTELLVLRAQGGDEEAFRKLHELWRDDIKRMAIARLGNQQSGTEVAQDAWIGIARGLARLNDPACFPRWALLIVQRKAADWIRLRQRERSAQSSAAQVELFCEAVSSSERGGLAELSEAIQGLDREARVLLSLYYEGGRSVAEISEILTVPVGTVKSRLNTVRERLRNKIERISS